MAKKKIYKNKEVEQEEFPPLMSMDDIEEGVGYSKIAKGDYNERTFRGMIVPSGGSIQGWDIGKGMLRSHGGEIILDSANKKIIVGTANKIFIDGKNNKIESDNYVSGYAGAGFHLSDELLEVGNIAARGLIRTACFQKDVISSVGGNLMVLDSDVLDTDMTAADNSTLKTKATTTFSVNDILRIKDGTDDEWLKVTAVAGVVYTVDRDKKGDYGAGANPAWKKGATVVNYGQSGDGGLYMTASESNAPYLSVFTHAGSPWTDLNTRLRIGNLNGYLGYSTDKYGIAIGETNYYLKYDPTNHLRIKGSVEITGGDAYDKLESNLPSDENLVGYWAFDEGQGSKAYDGSGNGNDGTLTNMEEADWVDGVAGSALNFDGADEYVTIPDDTSLEVQDFTISFWVYEEGADNEGIFGNPDGNNYGIGMYATGTSNNYNIINGYGSNFEVATTFVNLSGDKDKWTHIVLTRESKVLKYYKNGVYVDTHTFSYDTVWTTFTAFEIGRMANATYSFNGKIDEFRFYKNTVATAKEIYALYKNPSGQPSLAVPLGRLTTGEIRSKQMTMICTEGEGDAFIAFGKTDFGQDTTAGLIMGFDDSVAANPFKFEMTEGHIRTSTGNDRVEISSANNRIEFYNSDVLVGQIGKTSADGSFILYSGAESTKVPVVIENIGTANVARFRQNNSNVNCDPAIFFESNASGNSYTDSVITIHAGGVWNGSAWVNNTASTITGLLIENVARGCPLIIDNDQPAGGNRYAPFRITNQTFVPNYGSAGMLFAYNNYLFATERNHNDSSWVSYKVCRHENGVFSMGTLNHAGAGTTVFTGSLVYADQFPIRPEPIIIPETAAGNTANITDVSTLLTNASTTGFSYWVSITTSAALLAGFQLYWQAEETD